jgi:carbon-monoxide dehydrogenase medium subunit
VPDAVLLMEERGSVAVAGATWLAPLLKDRIIEPERLVYLGRIPDLRQERRVGDEIQLGACLTMHQLASSSLVSARSPLLARTAGTIANPRVRSVATVGGSVALGDGRQDLPAVLLALGARVLLHGPGGTRALALEHLHEHAGSALSPGELVTAVAVSPQTDRRAVYVRFAPGSAQDYLTVGVAAAVTFGPDGRVATARVALAGVAAHAIVPIECTERLVGRPLSADSIAAAADAAVDASSPRSDRLGSSDYKRTMARVWTRRALETFARG